ncbi:hypothetical protein [Agrobacterium pusense]|jgi:hypothetical protein|uniref:hypothetical protein n=1 Tax=Agrobacterium pusense TaxID=648995 RepID=UPI00245284C0|nr:hypothetical protein [Agrobacterium pusense]
MVLGLNTAELTTEALQDFDIMMIEASMKVNKFAGLASWLWGDVLRELEKRGRIKVASGSLDDVGNALIQRNY